MQGDLRVEVRGLSDEELDARIAALVASQGP
jgi:ribosomal protein L29